MAVNAVIIPKMLNKIARLLTIFVIFAPFSALADTYNCDEHRPCLPGIQEMVERYRQLYRRYGVHDVGLQTAEMSTLKGNYTRGLCQKCGDYFEGQDSYGEQENAPRVQKVIAFKGKENRRFLTDVEAAKYSGVGAITCEVGEHSWTSTAFLAGSFKIALTAAHTFNKRVRNQHGEVIKIVPAKPSDCVFQHTNQNGDVIETIELAKVISRWDDPKRLGNSEEDLAIVTLASESTTATNILPIAYFDGRDTPIELVGHHGNLREARKKRISIGTAYATKPGDFLFGAGRLYAHDAPMSGAASGSPIVSAKTGLVIGINIADTGDKGEGKEFSTVSNTNIFVSFDREFVATIKKEAGL